MSRPRIVWHEAGEARSAAWYSESTLLPPSRIVVADDTLGADAASRLACAGQAFLWRGDYQNARQLSQAMARRIERRSERHAARKNATLEPAELFHRYRLAQAQRAHILGMLLLPLAGDYGIPLRRAPDVRQACREAWGEPEGDALVSLRELLGAIGAHEWRKKGVLIPALAEPVYPHYGVFSPVRGEYVDLVAQAPLPAALAQNGCAFDIGTGTGVLAAVLARRGVARLVATDLNERALACARANIAGLGLSRQIELQAADLFPPGRAALIVCNPPWLPGRPGSALETAVYDPESRMLRAFLAGLAGHLEDGGEGWLILSDLAEHLGLRSRCELLAWIESAGLRVAGRLDIRPRHARASDTSDPLHRARAAELTSLWRLSKNSCASCVDSGGDDLGGVHPNAHSS